MKEKKTLKISVVGDIMCELPQLKASKRNGNYDFDKMFFSVEKLLSNSDYVIGNLETPISNKHFFTNELYCFNTPREFLKSLKKAHFDLLITSNNHCLDRGVKGLKVTMKNIIKSNMKYVGTRISKNEKPYHEIKIDDVKISFLAYTYGTNCTYNHCVLNKKNQYMVNLLKEQYPSYYKPSKERIKNLYNKVKINIKKIIKVIIRYKGKKSSFNPNDSIVVDNLSNGEWIISENKIKKIEKDISESNKSNDISILFIHSGGQFNKEPGSFTKNIVSKLSNMNVDCIICTHPHVVQKVDIVNDVFVAYSLGNFSISPSTSYLNHDLLPDYSVIFNIYIDKEEKNIVKYTFTILKMVEDKNHYLTIFPLYDLIKNENNKEKKNKLINDNLFIYNRFLNSNFDEIPLKKEYDVRM